MDLTSAIGSLGGDYVNKVTSAMKENASLSTSKSKNSDTTRSQPSPNKYTI